MRKALIVDDEFYVRASVVNRVDWKEAGFDPPAQAENGAQAMEILRREVVHVLISDVRMPIMDGLELVAKVRAEYPYICCIMLSGYDEFEYVRFALRQKAVDYLLKPVDPAALKELLLRCAAGFRLSGMDGLAVPASEGDRIRCIKGYIREHLEEDLSLKVMASRMFLSTSYLSTLFKQRTGYSFSAYVEAVRMERAKELLLNRDISISAVACRVGYPDQAYFSRVFKRKVGCSPKAYQRRRGIF